MSWAVRDLMAIPGLRAVVGYQSFDSLRSYSFHEMKALIRAVIGYQRSLGYHRSQSCQSCLSCHWLSQVSELSLAIGGLRAVIGYWRSHSCQWLSQVSELSMAIGGIIAVIGYWRYPSCQSCQWLLEVS